MAFLQLWYSLAFDESGFGPCGKNGDEPCGSIFWDGNDTLFDIPPDSPPSLAALMEATNILFQEHGPAILEEFADLVGQPGNDDLKLVMTGVGSGSALRYAHCTGDSEAPDA